MNTSSPNQATRSKWLNWEPTLAISAESAESGPTKPPEPGSVGFDRSAVTESRKVDELLDRPQKPLPKSDNRTGSTLTGQVVELWSTIAGRLFLVADEEDANGAMEYFGARRGEIYTAAEVQRIVVVNDPAVVAEIHEWKRRFNGTIRHCDSGL